MLLIQSGWYQKCFGFWILFGVLQNLLQLLLIENTNVHIQSAVKLKIVELF